MPSRRKGIDMGRKSVELPSDHNSQLKMLAVVENSQWQQNEGGCSYKETICDLLWAVKVLADKEAPEKPKKKSP